METTNFLVPIMQTKSISHLCLVLETVKKKCMAILQRSFRATYMKVLPHAATNIHVQHGIKMNTIQSNKS